ncbi:MAG: CDP-glycerol glycerophosphotransferase family protein [Bacteroidales bacterium]|nr:CDP-glycerol glycerophosphotransferase family protein [Bacteroidales bacterium]
MSTYEIKTRIANNTDNSLRLKLRLLLAHHDLLRTKAPILSDAYIRRFRQSQLDAAHRLRGKKRIEVAFMLTTPGMWKADYLFRAMQHDELFHPYVVVYPYSQYKGFPQKEIEETLQRTAKFVADKGFEYVIPRRNGHWEDIQKTMHPDIVFFATPYKDHLPQYFIHHFRNTLTCYIPYGFTNFSYLYNTNYNLIFHNLVGCYFLETESHLRLFAEHSRSHGAAGVVTGYPGTEVFLRSDYTPNNPWKPQPKAKKRVIWAPHHSIEEGFALSSFLLICDDMLRLAEKYKDSIQFAFKPHQLLRLKLLQIWGRERTDNYYDAWRDGSNTQLEESGYTDLFLTSDAMIHDSGSFTAEYLFTRKPVLFTVRSAEVRSRYSPLGQTMFDAHYHAATPQETEQFLAGTVLGGNDPMAECRQRLFRQHLMPSGRLPSENIINHLRNFVIP